MAHAARKTLQLEASYQEVAKEVEGASGRLGGLADASGRDQRKNWLVGVLNVITKGLHVMEPFLWSFLGSWKRCVVGGGSMQASLPNH